MKPKFTSIKNRILFPTLLTLTLATAGVHAATGIWIGGGGDGFWDATANTEWTGVSGSAWDDTNGPNNIAVFNSGNANPGTSGVPVTNGIIWNASGGISFGSVKMDGTNPFLNVTVAGTTSQLFANLTGTAGFTKTGPGQLFLISTVKGITGGFTVNQGLLRLDLNAVATASGVANSSNFLTLSGSSLEVFGQNSAGVSSQTLDVFTLNTGGSRIIINPNNASATTTLTLKDWTRTSGTNSSIYVDFTAANGTKILNLTGTIPVLTNSLIGSYATIRDTTGYGFATLDGSNNVVRYTGATTVASALGADTDANTNYKTTAGGALFNGTATTQTLNSLEINGNFTVAGNNAATYVLNSGGLLFSYSSGFPGYKADMTLTSATSELQVSVLPYNDSWSSASIRGVVDNGGTSVSLIKAGTGGLSMGTGAFTYTGDTIVNQGILDNIANIPSGAGKGNLVVNSQGIVALGLGATGTRTINGLSNTTLGGGTVNNQKYTSTAATAFLDLGNNNATAIFSGVISGNFSIIKSGTGTQTFSGNNTYTGATTVSAGTLSLVGGSQTSPITVNSGATLGFEVGSPTTSSSTVTFDATSKVSVTGTPAAVTLMTASSISGTPVLDPAIPGFTLQITATELKLVSGGASPYGTWAASYLPTDVSNPAGDNDNDGLVNQQEFAYGLNPTSGASVNPIIVQLNKTAGTFSYQRRAGTGLTYKILKSATLAAGSWVEDAGAVQVVIPSGENENVVVTLSGAPLTGDKLFVRVAAE